MMMNQELRRGRTPAALTVAIAAAAALISTAGTASAQVGGDGLPTEIRVVGTVSKLNMRKVEGKARRRCARKREGFRCNHKAHRPTRKALHMYRSLIPTGLEMPRLPMVGFWLTEVSAPYYVPGAPFTVANHWMEGAVEIRVIHRDQEGEVVKGWYPISYPVNSEFWFQAGRTVGLPKLHADTTSEPTETGWKMTAATPGAATPRFSLDFSPPSVRMSPRRLRLADHTALDPFLVLSPPFEGPKLNSVHYKVEPSTPPHSAAPGGAPQYDPSAGPDIGTVKLSFDPDINAYGEDLRPLLANGRTLATMVDPEQTLPGIHRFNRLLLNSVTTEIGEGGYER